MTTGTQAVDDYPGSDAITPDDVHWFNEGTHRSLGWRLGGHPLPDGGARFAVWAPNARAVSVIGDFNAWNESSNPLVSLGGSGIWEVVVPTARIGQVYKFAITTQRGELLHKADPFAHCTEVPPRTGSVLWDLAYQWNDAEWMTSRGGGGGVPPPPAVFRG